MSFIRGYIMDDTRSVIKSTKYIMLSELRVVFLSIFYLKKSNSL